MRNKIILSLFLLISISSFKAMAYGESYPNVLCNDCGSIEMRNRAVLNGEGDVHVLDLKRNIVRKYRVMSEREFGGSLVYAEQIAADPSIIADVQQISEVYKYVEQTETKTVDFIAHGSAYDLSGSSKNQNDFKDFFAANWTMYDKFALAVVNLINLVPQAPNISLRFEVYFEDGSHADLLVVGGNTLTGRVDTVLVDAKDANNNTIPLTQSSYNGEYEVRAGDMENFSRAASRNNVTTVYLPGYNPAPNTISVIVCRTTNGETTCTQTRVMVL